MGRPPLKFWLFYEHWSLQAHIWFFIASFGYVTYDIMFGFIPLYCTTPQCVSWVARPSNAAFEANFLTVFWAVCYLVDGPLYQIETYLYDSTRFRCTSHLFHADLGNTLSAIVYLASQCLYYHPYYTSTDMDQFFIITIAQAWLYFLSLTWWAFNSIQYWFAYLEERKDFKDTSVLWTQWRFWGELLNVIASFGYMGTSLWGLIVLYPWGNSAPFQAATPLGWWNYYQALYFQNQALQLVVNFNWDFIYSVDSLLYVKMWYDYGIAEWEATGGGEEGEGNADGKDEGADARRSRAQSYNLSQIHSDPIEI